MLKIRRSIILGIIILGLLLVTLSGCARSQPASTKAGLTAEQAVNVIVSDLRQHGISIKNININKIIPDKSGSMASVEFVITLQDGRTLTEKVNLSKENGRWVLQGHKH